MIRGLLAVLLSALLVALGTPAVGAVAPPLPETKWTPRVVDPYPDQMPAAGIAGAYSPPAPGAFLTLPCLDNCHFVSSIFDHCGPAYSSDGRICRFDGAEAIAANGIDFGVGYAMTPGSDDWLYYDGHDGWDLGIYYEPVLAAADGIVSSAGWMDPGCHRCGFGQGVRIDHGNGYDTLYGHLWRIDVVPGQHVFRGEVIAVSGATGNAAGEHLHWSLYRHGTYAGVDPFGWAGPGSDPWPNDAGNLWLGGVARTPAIPQARVSVTAAPVGDGSDIALNWWSPGAGPAYTVSVYTDGGRSELLTSHTQSTGMTFHGALGHVYWFRVDAVTALGSTDSAASATVDLTPGRTVPNRS